MSRSAERAVAAALIVAGSGLGLSLAISVGMAQSPAPKPAATQPAAAQGKAGQPGKAEKQAPTPQQVAAVPPKRFGVGRLATVEEVAGWDIDVRPDGRGLPVGKGTVKEGEALYQERCASCHGEFGEAVGRWPYLAGGAGTLKSDDPHKSIGSYWPYASTVFDYVRRAMPYGNAQSLTNDELYAITAYVLFLNDVITDENAELSDKTFPSVRLANEANFFDDDREVSERQFWKKEPCMSGCVAGEPKIIGRARMIDVTPETGKGPKVD